MIGLGGIWRDYGLPEVATDGLSHSSACNTEEVALRSPWHDNLTRYSAVKWAEQGFAGWEPLERSTKKNDQYALQISRWIPVVFGPEENEHHLSSSVCTVALYH